MTQQLDLFAPAPTSTHDPLCTFKDLHPELCDCEVIAKARADERARILDEGAECVSMDKVNEVLALDRAHQQNLAANRVDNLTPREIDGVLYVDWSDAICAAGNRDIP